MQAANLTPEDMNALPIAEIQYRGICGDQLNSGNDFAEKGIKQIMTSVFTIEQTYPNQRTDDESKHIKDIHIHAKFSNITLSPPTKTCYTSSKEVMLTPQVALANKKTYASPLLADIDITATAQQHDGKMIEKKASMQGVQIALVPVMVRSKLCNTYNKTFETLRHMREDPSDPGGYFIIRGVEWVINSIESSTYNKPKIFRNIGHDNEVARLEMISKPGDSYENSSQIFIKLLTNNCLIVQIDRNPLNKIQIPFYVLMRLLGWTHDRQIVKWIAPNPQSSIDAAIIKKLDSAYKATYDGFPNALQMREKNEIIESFIHKIDSYAQVDMTDEKMAQLAHQRAMKSVDLHLFPHIGTTVEDRNEKAKCLTHLIRRLFMVEMGAVSPTDRDSLKNKRVHSAGVSFAKAFKQQFNFMVARQIKSQFRSDVKSTSFSRLDLVRSLTASFDSTSFARALAQAITTGSKQQITIKAGRKITNRLTSQQLHRKNQMNFVSTMRQINSPNSNSSKQSARANEMRRVHSSYTGYICPIQTQDGESVGVNKQLAIAASITLGRSSTLLKDIINKDPDFTKLENVTPEYLASGAAVVKVNGHWIGCVQPAHAFVKKYRMRRRAQEIDPYTTIFHDVAIDEAQFWVDTGRLTRPLLIVHTDEKKFHQYVKLTREHIEGLKSGQITMEDLLNQNIIEYISPSEQENLLIAIDHDELWENRTNPLKPFTHCDIPAALMGFACLNCPLGAHAPAARVILSTQQSKQACGWYSLAWPFRIDKSGFLQHSCEMPMVRTIANEYLQPNGMNCVVAVQIYSGYNQEDSIILNKGAVERGLFSGVHFTFIMSELEKNEQFGNPDAVLTSDIKPYASYEKIFDGFPKKGAVIHRNDVVIGKFAKINKPDQHRYIDRSQVYKHEEPAIVNNVIVGRDEDGKQFAKVQLMVIRDPTIGDKFCLDDQHEVLTTEGWVHINHITRNHTVATLGPNNTLEYQQVERKYTFRHRGDMYKMCNDRLDLLATAEHKMYARMDSKYELVPAASIDSAYFLKGACNHMGVTPGASFSQDMHKLDMVESRRLARLMMNGNTFLTDDAKLAGKFQQLILQCGGWTCDQRNISGGYQLDVRFSSEVKVYEEDIKIVQFDGFVYCIEVPNHIFMVRRNGKCVWTGNSMRSGQKGVAGNIMNEEDMPFSSNGMIPDVIFNPHSLPSRMTINTPMEMLIGKTFALKGKVTDGTIFRKTNIPEIQQELKKMGFNPAGTEQLYNGMTGKYIDYEIFVGVAFYQRLEKFVNETIYAVSRGSTDAVTRQPLDGKSSNGGLRIGEMETQALSCNGVSRFIAEKLFDHSDGFDVYICRRCGDPAIVNHDLKLYKCKTCGDNADIAKVPSSWATKLFMQELKSIGVGVKSHLKPYRFNRA